MDMQIVVSTNVRAVGYCSQSRVMRVHFQSGGVYDYFDVEPSLYESMLQPHPWRRLGDRVKRHRSIRVD